MLSDHGQTQGATFKQRNGYGLEDLVERSLAGGEVAAFAGGDEQTAMVGHAVGEATGSKPKKRAKNDVSDRHVVVLGSGNLGLIYLMEERRRLTLEEIDERHPRLVPALREHPHVGWLLIRSAEHGAVVLGPAGMRHLGSGEIEGEDPLASFSETAAEHLIRTDGFAHVADIMVGSFYDPERDEGCAFEELISFHGGLGGAQTRPFILHRDRLPVPEQPILGAAAVHGLLSSWRRTLQGERPASPRGSARALRRSTAPARPGPGRIPVTEALSYVGHSTLLLEAGGARFLTDPVLGPGIGHIRRRVPAPRIESLLPLDAVLLSHAHHDHLHPRSLRRVARDCPVRGAARLREDAAPAAASGR